MMETTFLSLNKITHNPPLQILMVPIIDGQCKVATMLPPPSTSLTAITEVLSNLKGREL